MANSANRTCQVCGGEITPEQISKKEAGLLKGILHCPNCVAAKRAAGLALPVAIEQVQSEGSQPAMSVYAALRRRRVFLGALPLTAAAVVLFLLLTPRAPAQGLARTLRAMAQVQSAHCRGWHVTYRVSGKEIRSSAPNPRMCAAALERKPNRSAAGIGRTCSPTPPCASTEQSGE